jgi:hypothetical protein
MSHLQLIQEAAPIFNQNPEGGVYLITSSIAVSKIIMHFMVEYGQALTSETLLSGSKQSW